MTASTHCFPSAIIGNHTYFVRSFSRSGTDFVAPDFVDSYPPPHGYTPPPPGKGTLAVCATHTAQRSRQPAPLLNSALSKRWWWKQDQHNVQHIQFTRSREKACQEPKTALPSLDAEPKPSPRLCMPQQFPTHTRYGRLCRCCRSTHHLFPSRARRPCLLQFIMCSRSNRASFGE